MHFWDAIMGIFLANKLGCPIVLHSNRLSSSFLILYIIVNHVKYK